MTLARLRALPVPALVLVVAAACALLLTVPGATVTTRYVNDLLIFLDGAHRIASGQVPNRDFHTALGPLVYYLPAAGYRVSGTLGGAMPTGLALAVLALAPAVAYVAGSRLRPAIALPFSMFLLVVAAVPANLGESIADLSFAMFYNRLGWVALATLLLMHLPPRPGRPKRDSLDTLAAAGLTLAMLYLKLTYGVVALAFLMFVASDARQRRWAVAALATTVVGALLVDVFWRATLAHIADLRLAGEVSGIRPAEDLIEGVLRHVPDFAIVAILVVLALRATRSLREALFFGFCIIPGLLILNQNAQPWGILSLHAGAAVAAELAMRREDLRPRMAERPALARGAPLLAAALVLPTIAHCAAALGLHAALATARAGESFALPQFDGIRLVELWSPGEHQLSKAYLESLRDGARLLSALDPKPTRVSVLDFANGLSAGLGLTPPRGDSAWLHWGRNVDERHFLAPKDLFVDVGVLMVPKWGVNHAPLFDLYGPYIVREFRPVRDSAGWTAYVRREAQRLARTEAATPGTGRPR